ncbi:glycosyltransferase family 2 protein [Thalassococcus sp. BH17M4-6]|uniref:glycosyltransferase family 2 protein n=1 Tax=Thalassococcus sp. BH17M4-6 TaxID=3413148 RepID=UPI003BDFD6A7
MIRWGIVSTVKAPFEQIAGFCAWHLDAGATHIYLYLDEDAPNTLARLNTHPQITALHTDADWWAKRKGRPEKHQARQSVNARHANNRFVNKAEPALDWLAHIDVDEFLIAERPVADQLAGLSPDTLCARVRPIEALASEGTETVFKAFHLDQAARQRAALACFPTWGAHLSGGFLSHVAGKLFFRTGLKRLQIKIHNILLDCVQNPGQVELPGIELGHFHAHSWDHFLAAYRFRLARGSYRAELHPQVRQPGALSLHDLFRQIEAEGGEAALRAFYEEVAVATPALCARLDAEGLLRRYDLDLAARRARHFR